MEHGESYILGLGLIFVLGFAARWIAWRLHMPSILLLLIAGLAAGNAGFHLLDPDALFGNLLAPFVSVSVAIILFEGGLSLDLRELREIGGVVRNLVSIGALVTWVLAAFGAWLILELSAPLALLMGAIFVVTGPTVVIPLLRHVRPTPRIRNTIKWEGILNDPIGAILAVLVFEAILAGGGRDAPREFLYSILTGAGVGVAGAVVMLVALKFHWVPDALDNAFSLAMIVGAFVGSNHLKAESGLLATTVMGIVLANQHKIAVRHIVEFKENLRVLIISTLFILLAARLKADELLAVWIPSLGYLLLLLFIVRPAAVWVSCMGSKLTREERIFLSWMAPRGIVAAAVSSIFASRLVSAGIEEASSMVPIAFLVIMGTVAVYGLGAFPLAKRLGLAEPSPQGVLFVGAHAWARKMAKALHEQGVNVALADSRRVNVAAARMEGLPAYFGGILSQEVLDSVNLHGIGKLAAVTSNAEANSLAAVHFTEVFGRKDVYQLSVEKDDARRGIEPIHLQGRGLFSAKATFELLEKLFQAGAEIKTSRMTEKFDMAAFRARYGDDALPLFILARKDDEVDVMVVTAGQAVRPRPGQILISAIPAKALKEAERLEKTEKDAAEAAKTGEG
jgi:NhaP-type Na+/H+ or K+/H+ antiporter